MREAVLAGKDNAEDPGNGGQVCSVRIELIDTEPLIWREVEVPAAITLTVLHDIVQAAMGWTNSHLWEFTVGKQRFAPQSAAKVRLCDLLGSRRTRIGYLYDFGDSWEHLLTVSGVRNADPALAYPRYLGGEWNAPPDDCGGLPGFYNALDAIEDQDHPDREEILEWFGDYDPKTIDTKAIASALARIAKRPKTPAARARKPKS